MHFKEVTQGDLSMVAEEKKPILEWKKEFCKAVSNRPEKELLEKKFDSFVEKLDGKETKRILEYLFLLENGKTDSEKIYFTKKTVETLLARNE